MSRAQDGQPNYAKIVNDGAARDLLSDNSRDGSKCVRKESVGFEMDFSPTTIEEELFDGGWNRIQRPVGGDPINVPSSGGRGEPGDDYDEPTRGGRYPGY